MAIEGAQVPPTEKKELVVVTYASGPNQPGISATLADGTLKIGSFQTLIGGPGFGYSLATFDRKGIKQVGTEKVQLTVFAATIVKNRSHFIYRMAVYINSDSVDTTLKGLKGTVAAFLAANRN